MEHRAQSMEKKQKTQLFLQSAEEFQLQEPGASYYIDFDAKKDNIPARDCNMIIWPGHAKLGKRENSAVVSILLSPLRNRTVQRFHFDEDSTETKQ